MKRIRYQLSLALILSSFFGTSSVSFSNQSGFISSTPINKDEVVLSPESFKTIRFQKNTRVELEVLGKIKGNFELFINGTKIPVQKGQFKTTLNLYPLKEEYVLKVKRPGVSESLYPLKISWLKEFPLPLRVKIESPKAAPVFKEKVFVGTFPSEDWVQLAWLDAIENLDPAYVAKLEREKQEKERLEAERIERERVERERQEEEQRRLAKLEEERIEKERIEKERMEAERIEKERVERERQEEEQRRLAKLEEERIERERLQKEEQERILKVQQELARVELERKENERLEKERLEKERREEEKKRLAKQEEIRLEKEREQKEHMLRMQQELVQLEKERLEAERLEKERLQKEKIEEEQRRLAHLEAERLARERKQAELEEKAREKAERERKLAAELAEEKAEKERELAAIELEKANALLNPPKYRESNGFSLNQGFGSFSLKQTDVDVTASNLVVNLAYQTQIQQNLRLFVSGQGTLVPFSVKGAASSPTWIKTEGDVGYLLEPQSGVQWTPFAGITYQTVLTSESIGYRNLFGPRLGISLGLPVSPLQSIQSSLSLALFPTSEQILNLSNNEIHFKVAFERKISSSLLSSLSLGVDYSSLKLNLSADTLTSSGYSLFLGLNF